MRRPRLPLVLLALLVLAAGCSSGSKEEAVPWIPDRPAQLGEREPASTDCRASDLAVQGQIEFAPYNATGGIAVIALRNTSRRVCRLAGRAAVRIVKDGPRQTQKPIAVPPTIFPDVSPPRSTLLALRPGDYGGLTITWENWCDPLIPGKPRPAPTAIRITLPDGGGSLDADYNAVPSCVDPHTPAVIGVSPFETARIPKAPAFTSARMTATVPGQPLQGKRGELVHFQVVLKNTSQLAVDFDTCPAYIQQLVPRGTVEGYMLNCAAAQPIEPGKSLAFDMQIRVPANAPLGGNGLFWGLDPFGGGQPQAQARVDVSD